jgi:hypothetical protein
VLLIHNLAPLVPVRQAGVSGLGVGIHYPILRFERTSRCTSTGTFWYRLTTTCG